MAKVYTLKSGTKIEEKKSKAWIPTLAAFVVFILCSILVLQSRGVMQIDQLPVILKQLFTPTDIVIGKVHLQDTWKDYFGYLFSSEIKQAFWETMRMSFVGSIIGAVLCLPFAIVCSKNVIKTKWISVPVRFLINLIRTLPTMVVAVMAVFFVGLGALSGIIATAIFTFGIMTKMMYEAIEALDMGPYEALEACGANKLKAFFYALFPQIMPTYLGYFIYNFEINVRTSVVLGYVGAGGLGTILRSNMDNVYTRSRVGAIIIMMFVIVLVLQAFTRFCRTLLQEGTNEYKIKIKNMFKKKPQRAKN